jgi:hypothetical protein
MREYRVEFGIDFAIFVSTSRLEITHSAYFSCGFINKEVVDAPKCGSIGVKFCISLAICAYSL